MFHNKSITHHIQSALIYTSRIVCSQLFQFDSYVPLFVLHLVLHLAGLSIHVEVVYIVRWLFLSRAIILFPFCSRMKQMMVNHFLFSGANNLIPMEIALKVARKIRARERFSVYIVIPMWPEGVPTSTPTQRILFWQVDHHILLP